MKQDELYVCICVCELPEVEFQINYDKSTLFAIKLQLGSIKGFLLKLFFQFHSDSIWKSFESSCVLKQNAHAFVFIISGFKLL